MCSRRSKKAGRGEREKENRNRKTIFDIHIRMPSRFDKANLKKSVIYTIENRKDLFEKQTKGLETKKGKTKQTKYVLDCKIQGGAFSSLGCNDSAVIKLFNVQGSRYDESVFITR